MGGAVTYSLYWRALRGSSSPHVRGSGYACAPPVGLQHRLQCSGGTGEVAVVDATVIQLAGELAEQLRPVSPGRFEEYADLHPSLDHLDRSSVGGRGTEPVPGLGAGRWPNTSWGSALGFPA